MQRFLLMMPSRKGVRPSPWLLAAIVLAAAVSPSWSQGPTVEYGVVLKVHTDPLLFLPLVFACDLALLAGVSCSRVNILEVISGTDSVQVDATISFADKLDPVASALSLIDTLRLGNGLLQLLPDTVMIYQEPHPPTTGSTSTGTTGTTSTGTTAVQPTTASTSSSGVLSGLLSGLTGLRKRNIEGVAYVDAKATCEDACKGSLDAPFTTLSSAVESLPRGGMVVVRPGIYGGSTNVNLALADRPFYFVSTGGSASTIIDCEGRAFAFDVSSSVVGAESFQLSGVTVRNCRAREGGALRLRRTPAALTDVAFVANAAEVDGGAVWAADADVEMIGCAFESNRAGRDGGDVYVRSAKVKVDKAAKQAGGVAARSGGAIYCESASVELSSATSDVFARGVAEASQCVSCAMTHIEAAGPRRLPCGGARQAAVMTLDDDSMDNAAVRATGALAAVLAAAMCVLLL